MIAQELSCETCKKITLHRMLSTYEESRYKQATKVAYQCIKCGANRLLRGIKCITAPKKKRVDN